MMRLLAEAAAVALAAGAGAVSIDDDAAVGVSFPDFHARWNSAQSAA